MKPSELTAAISSWQEACREARQGGERIVDRERRETPARERQRVGAEEELRQGQEDELATLAEERERALAELAEEQARARRELEHKVVAGQEELIHRRDQAYRKLGREAPPPDDDDLKAMRQRANAFQAILEEVEERLARQRPRVVKLERRLGTPGEKAQPETLKGPIEDQLLTLRERTEAFTADLTALEDELRDRWLSRWRNGLLITFIVVLHASAMVVLPRLLGGYSLEMVAGVTISFLLLLGIRLGLAAWHRRRLRTRFTGLHQRYRLLEHHLPFVGEQGRQQLDLQRSRAKHAKRVLDHSNRYREAENEIRDSFQEAMANLKRQAESKQATLDGEHRQAREECERRHDARQDELRARHRAEITALQGEYEETERHWREQLADEQNDARAAFEATLADGRRTLERLAAAEAPAPYDSLPLGELQARLHSVCPDSGRLADDQTVALPLRIDIPHLAQLWLRSDSDTGRGQAHALLRTAALELLERLPAGQLRLTVFDPIGHGQSFADFLPLVDIDERILGPKIWTKEQELEERLAFLVDHTELVIQKHLQKKHPDVSHYNAEAGELAEPYHLLILLDAPDGVRDLALQRLRGLLTCGARTGVLVWLHQHRGELLPSDRLHGWALREEDGELQVAHDGLDDWSLRVAAPSDQEVAARILAVGQAASQAARVAIDMRIGMPAEEETWTADSAEGLRIPIGRCGAERMQHLDLGQGMAQHVLLGGRTGSGKSTLLHVIIANASCWYGPDQLQLSLIDFKKGVEFRAYAEHRLPQARVIAIESDREFALSVLEDIDRELDRRGALFREHGVQNIAQFRNASRQAMPRQLLIIDEFHEFFADDDALSRSASLLIDRLVRQGRAFGIHAVLGSQSLAGCYALGKSTLGQIAVRIALQCNEADSYLLLSEDNPAARYLERPGEGIYNDRSGLPDGNSPFQVFWLDDDERDVLLAGLRGRLGPEAPSPVVFEGNAPARIADQAALLPAPGAGGWICHLGQPNALAGPTAIDLAGGASPHLLIAGQHREAACGLAGAILLSLLRQHGRALGVEVLDRSTDRRFAEFMERLAADRAADINHLDPATLDDWAASLAADRGPRCCLLLGIDNLPQLAEPDDDPFGLAGGDAPAGPGAAYADTLRREAGENHIVAWYASPATLHRNLQRKTRQALSRRVLFQMSAADSNELLDDGSAGHLGLYHALLAETDSGRREKFRPYALPAAEELPGLLPGADAATTDAPSTEG